MKTFIYVVSTGSMEIFKLLVDLLEPESFQIPLGNLLSNLVAHNSTQSLDEISSQIDFSTDYSLLHYV